MVSPCVHRSVYEFESYYIFITLRFLPKQGRGKRVVIVSAIDCCFKVKFRLHMIDMNMHDLRLMRLFTVFYCFLCFFGSIVDTQLRVLAEEERHIWTGFMWTWWAMRRMACKTANQYDSSSPSTSGVRCSLPFVMNYRAAWRGTRGTWQGTLHWSFLGIFHQGNLSTL